jgi:DNA mismatch repair protein MutS2
MDADVQRALEFAKVLDILARYATTSMGRRKALALRPAIPKATLRQAFQETSEMVQAISEGYHLPLGSIEDVSGHARRARAGGEPLEPAALCKVAECLETAQRVANSLQRVGATYPALAGLGHAVPTCPELVDGIRKAIEPGGRVMDSASDELRSIRRRVRSLRGRIEAVLRHMVEDADVRPHLQYPNPTMCRERYVLPVNAYSKHSVRGIVHGSSDSGATLYVEPLAIVEAGNELSAGLAEEEEEIRRILWELTRQVGERRDDIVTTVDRLGEVDLVSAKARLALVFGMCEPLVVDGRMLEFRDARHPLLLWLTRPKGPELPAGTPEALPGEGDLHSEAVVPLNVRVGDDFDLLILTGPNTGGKTVVLKTVGLLCLMARAGIHVPAERAAVPLYDAVFADIGDEQSLEQSLSTFSSHMSRLIRILDCATPRSLVLLDELGAGTDPAEGSAIGEAVLKRLAAMGSSALVVTHLGRLKTFATARPRVENASMEFDIHTLRPTYRLAVGSVGSSCAIEIAERLGLPPEILADARRLLDATSGGEYSMMLEEVRMAREDAEARRDRMQYLEEEAARLKTQYEEVLARLQAEDERRGASLGFQLRDALHALLAEAEAAHKDARPVNRSLTRRLAGLRTGLRKCLDDVEMLLGGHRLERELQPGDEVYVVKVHRWGKIERVDQRSGRATVQVGNTQIDADLSDLEPWGEGVTG